MDDDDDENLNWHLVAAELERIGVDPIAARTWARALGVDVPRWRTITARGWTLDDVVTVTAHCGYWHAHDWIESKYPPRLAVAYAKAGYEPGDEHVRAHQAAGHTPNDMRAIIDILDPEVADNVRRWCRKHRCPPPADYRLPKKRP